MNRRNFFGFLAGAACTPVVGTPQLATGGAFAPAAFAGELIVPAAAKLGSVKIECDTSEFRSVIADMVKQVEKAAKVTGRSHEPDDWRGY